MNQFISELVVENMKLIYSFDLTFTPNTPVVSLLQQVHYVLSSIQKPNHGGFPCSSMYQKEIPRQGFPRGFLLSVGISVPENIMIRIRNGSCLLAIMGFPYDIVEEDVLTNSDFSRTSGGSYGVMCNGQGPSVYYSSHCHHSSNLINNSISQASSDRTGQWEYMKPYFIQKEMNNFDFDSKNVVVEIIDTRKS